jgi:hypothetical protein
VKAYVVTSGALFAVLVLAHLWRLVAEGTGPVHDPWFLAFTGTSAALSIWAFASLRRGSAP